MSAVIRAEAKRSRLGAGSLIRTAQWSLMTLWPSGGQQRARSNALIGSSDDGYAEPPFVAGTPKTRRPPRAGRGARP